MFSFSGHETFPLRFLWLPKAVRAAAENPGVFQSDEAIATFEEDEGAYDQADAEGFIRLSALRLRTVARRAARDRG